MHGARSGQCPNCGGPIEFKLASSAALVCPWCHHSIVRTDRDLRSIGKIADLVPTAPIMAVGDYGTLSGEEFVVGGRLQLDHGKGPWDEWYVELPRARKWAWLAKAQGKFYLTYPAPGATGLPTWDQMTPGAQGKLGGGGDVLYTVAERGGSALLSAEGELPFPAVPGSSGRYVDVVGPDDRFGTIDYGDGTEPPQLFLGSALDPDAVKFREGGGRPRPEQQVELGRLSCPTCGAPVAIAAPDTTERAVCSSCDSALDYHAGQLAFLEQLSQPRIPPLIALGTKGNLAGREVMVIGFMQRSTRVDGITYAWREYLLHSSGGYLWLVENNGHFSVVTPISAGDVTIGGDGAHYQGRKYRPFSSSGAKVDYVIGEFYWRVEVGERTQANDYVAPPYMLSEERSTKEANWSHGEYVDGKDVQRAFGLAEELPDPYDVAPNQPNPVRRTFPLVFGLVSVLALLVVYFITQPHGENFLLVKGPVDMPAKPDPVMVRKGSAGRRHIFGVDMGALTDPSAVAGLLGQTTTREDDQSRAVTFTEAFEIPKGRKAVEIALETKRYTGWVGVAMALINEATGKVHELALEIDQYNNIGEHVAKANITDLTPGSYRLRTDARWADRATTAAPPAVTLTIRTIHARESNPSCCCFAALLLLLPGGLALVRRSAFEKRRWQGSDFS